MRGGRLTPLPPSLLDGKYESGRSASSAWTSARLTRPRPDCTRAVSERERCYYVTVHICQNMKIALACASHMNR